ncbi:hypothetical protein TNCV_2400431 [Trichonephila clavipes]|uniref:Uncharacterized protein n=1 Tax=Trichonephila clavipes TaxID=2585209 RepID=A0A8X6SWT9_TRICX|nr:hypothetical protein TNCV_2400431 [Trichonephila clavipes]
MSNDPNEARGKAGTTISRYYLRRGEISGINVFIGYIVRASNKGARKKKDERVSRNEREVTSEEQKIELAKLQLAKLEKEIELQTAKNKALSLNPAAKVEEKQFETNIENMIKSIKTLSLPVPPDLKILICSSNH